MTTETILIVDDEQIVRRLMGDALQRAGYTVELAASGAEALERLSRPGIDLMLLDLQLGDLDGVQVMRVAREHWPELQIMMLTAHGSLTSAIAAVRHGAADYLLKPLPVEPWVGDGTRVLAERRAEHTRRIRAELDAAGRRYVTVSGSFEQRTATARRLVAGLVQPSAVHYDSAT